MTNKIETFEELVGKISSLSKEMTIDAYNKIIVFYLSKRHFKVQYLNKYHLTKVVSICGNIYNFLIAEPTKSPQEIYNVIKAIKECENEQN